jgi:phage tail-like protein
VPADLDDLPRPDLSPPTLPVSLGAEPAEDELHKRGNGRETPWLQIEEADRFETYEVPLMDREAGETVGAVGRFLWIALELSGDTLKTPRIRCLRAEHPSHDWLRRLPKVYSRDAAAADFLRRYLAMFEGFLGEVEAKAGLRRALVDPWSAPDALLPWLAGFVGLVVDERWSVEVRRRLLDEIIELWRARGTVAGLRRFLEIVTEGRVAIVEHWRLRPDPGAVVGGAGMAAFEPFAHRFTVVLAASLDEEALASARHVLEEHRPAHTLYALCSAAAGMRVGRGLHLGLTTVVGQSGAFATLQIGASVLGRGAVVGRAVAGTVAGASRLGGDSRVG